MKRMMMVFTVLLGFTLAVTLEGSSHKPAGPKPAKPKAAAPRAPPSTMAFAPGINRPDLEFVNWVYRAQQGGTTETHLYTAIAQRRHVNPAMGPSDHEHNQQWRFLTVREYPAPPPLP